MSTLSLFTSQILLWNYLFLLALEKKHILIIAHRAFPQKNKTGGKKEEEGLGGMGRGVIHSVSLAYEKRLTTIAAGSSSAESYLCPPFPPKPHTHTPKVQHK